MIYIKCLSIFGGVLTSQVLFPDILQLHDVGLSLQCSVPEHGDFRHVPTKYFTRSSLKDGWYL